jgi:predicted transcriptional regulator
MAAVSKAIAGALTAALVSYLMKENIVIADELPNAIEVILSAVIGFIGVYLAPRNTNTDPRV